MHRTPNWVHFKLSIMNRIFNILGFKYLSMKVTFQCVQVSIFPDGKNSLFLIYFHWQIFKNQGNCVSHSWCLVWNVSSLVLCKFPSLFSTVKLNLGNSCSQFTLRFKLGFLNYGLSLYFKVFPNLRKNWKWGFSIASLVGYLNFSHYMKEIKNWYFYLLAKVPCAFKLPNSLKSWKSDNLSICQIVSLSGIFQLIDDEAEVNRLNTRRF